MDNVANFIRVQTLGQASACHGSWRHRGAARPTCTGGPLRDLLQQSAGNVGGGGNPNEARVLMSSQVGPKHARREREKKKSAKEIGPRSKLQHRETQVRERPSSASGPVTALQARAARLPRNSSRRMRRDFSRFPSAKTDIS